MLSLDLVQAAAGFLADRVRMTPLEHSPRLSDEMGVPVWLKLENLQLTGSFKLRGAWYACARLYDQGIRHVATCSAGNHGKAVAYAARELGMKTTIYVPSSVDETKFRAMKRLGSEVIVSDFRGYDDTERWARDEIERKKWHFLSAYDDEIIMAGNGGSVALEVQSQLPDANTFVMPAGGGGHAAGFAYTLAQTLDAPRFIICQHEHSPAYQLSLEKGAAVTELPGIETVASGLEGGFGQRTFDVLREFATEVSLVSEAGLRAAMRWMVDHHQYVIEGSAAAGIAACLDWRLPAPEGPVVVFVSGRNVSLETIRKVLCEPITD